MAIVLVSPNGGERKRTGRTVQIEWTDTAGHTVTIKLSKDGGSTYDTVIDTGIAAVTGTNTYNWSPAQADESEEARIRVENDSNPGTDFDDSDADFFVRPVSITLKAPNGTQYPNGVHLNSLVNIRWSDDEGEANDVMIELSTNGGSSYGFTIAAAATYDKGEPHFVWTPSATVGSTFGNCKIRVQSNLAGDSDNFAVTSVAFAIVNTDPVTNYAGTDLDYPRYFLSYGQTKGLRAIEEDEFTTRDQFVAGPGIQIIQHEETGGADRQTLEFRTERAAPRTLTGEILCSTSAGDGYTIANGFFGNHVYGDINHSWGLDIAAKYVITLFNIPEGGSPITVKTHPQHEALNSNTIRLHIVDKSPLQLDGSTLPGVRSRKYRFTLVEVLDELV